MLPERAESPERPKTSTQNLLRAFIRPTCVSIGMGVAIGIALAIDLTIRNGERFDSSTAVLAMHLSGLYTLLTSFPLVLSSTFCALIGRPATTRALFAIGASFYVLLNALLRFNPTIQPASVVPHITIVGIADLLVIVAATTLVGMGIAERSRIRAVRLLGSGIALLAGLWIVNALNEQPLRRDLATLVSNALMAENTPDALPDVQQFENARLIVLGFDGLSWEVLLPLMRRGELPGFNSLLKVASYGYLDTLDFTISPVVWETISTGQAPDRHGIGYHGHFDFPGVDWRVRRLPAYPLASSPMAIRRLLVALSGGLAPWSQVVAASSDAKVARFWEIASRSGYSVGVFNWVNTEPASPLEGFSRGYYRALPPFDFPADLDDGFELPEVHPQSNLTGDRFLADRPKETALYDHFVDLALAESPEVLLYYTHYGDGSNHLFWRDETYGPRFVLPGVNHPEFDPGAKIASAHRVLDEILGDVLARKRDDATVIVVSDHGFDYRGYEHDNGPSGVWIARGDGIRSGLVEDISVFDVAPTLLQVLEIPIADDMQGRVMPIAEAGGRIDYLADRVPTYGPASGSSAAEVDEAGLDKHLEYLRSLGYVD